VATKPTDDQPRTYSRAEVRELQRKAASAEQQLTIRTVRAAKVAKGKPIATAMNSKQQREYAQLKKRAQALGALAERAAAHKEGFAQLARRLTPEDTRLARIHLRTAAQQVAKLFQRSKAGGGGKAGGAKARSH
jgi:hypothetical protein